jgi:hypothetical protein
MGNITAKAFNSLISGKGFTSAQISEIMLGINDGLSIDKILLYANPDFSHLQMRKIRISMKDGGMSIVEGDSIIEGDSIGDESTHTNQAEGANQSTQSSVEEDKETPELDTD